MPRTVQQTRVGPKQLLGATVSESTAGLWSFGHNCHCRVFMGRRNAVLSLMGGFVYSTHDVPRGLFPAGPDEPLSTNSARLRRCPCLVAFPRAPFSSALGWRGAAAGAWDRRPVSGGTPCPSTCRPSNDHSAPGNIQRLDLAGCFWPTRG